MKKERSEVIQTERLAEGIFSLWLKTDVAKEAKAGQFVLLYCNDASHLLGRPLCVCETRKESSELRIVFRVSGGGTGQFSELKTGDTVFIEGPLGRGYDPSKAEDKTVLLMGGGVGAPSLLQLARELKSINTGEVTAVLGYRDSSLNTFLSEDFKKLCDRVVIATDDGSCGVHGNVMDAIVSEELSGQVIFACGPLPMLRAVSKYASDSGTDAYISLEERMACGVGVCLGCVVKTRHKDGHSQVNNARICTEGPVFKSTEVAL